MAHFQAGIQGSRGPATRLGTSKSGIYAFARGWDGGARIELWQKNDQDYVSISVGPWSNPSKIILIEGPINDIVENAYGIRDAINGKTICY